MSKIELNWFGIVLLATCAVVYVSSEACIQCNSAADPRCATETNFMAKACTNSSSKCYTRVLNGATIRGCASELDNATVARCNNEMECVICGFMDGCNRQIFPMYRAQCLQCEGNSTSVCARNVYASPTVCPNYKLGDKCFIRRKATNDTKATSFMRGCLSSVQAERKLCVNETNCYTCEGNGCNNLLFNSTLIPMARDSASGFGYSTLTLLLAAAFASAASSLF